MLTSNQKRKIKLLLSSYRLSGLPQFQRETNTVLCLLKSPITLTRTVPPPSV